MKPSIFLNELIDLKHMETLEKMPFEAQHKIFKRLAEIADSKTLTKEEQEKYDNSMMVMWDVMGEVKPECLPEWAKEKAQELLHKKRNKDKER